MVPDSALKHTRIYQMLAFIVVLIATGCATDILDREPAQKDMQMVPAVDLAKGYLAAKTGLELLKRHVKLGSFSGSGARFILKVGGEAIHKGNVNEYLAKYQKQLSLYEASIKQRGFASIAGVYKGETTKSCAKSSSFLAAILQKGAQTHVEIRQEGFDAQIVLSPKVNDKEVSVENPAVIAETAIVVIDAMNSDYYFHGDVKDQLIILKPDLSVLDTWPKWANPPSRNDLEKCTVSLELI